MNSYSIYFGSKLITIAESKGRKIVNSLDIPRDKVLQAGIEDKIPEEVRIVAFINNELRKNRFEIKEAAVIISGNDLITRTFDLPSSLSQRELAGAIHYEARKYIPFKIEDLVTGFQWQLDMRSKKYLVLFLGLKKEVFDKYIYIFKQLNIKIDLIEYSAFSIIRFLKLTGCRFNGITAVIDIDLSDIDEGNFVVLENEYPLFSRDINLFSGLGIESLPKDKEKIFTSVAADKFKAELRMSLDFYQRKFPAKRIEKLYLISPQDCRNQIEAFMKEKGLIVEFVDFQKYVENVSLSSLGFFKAFGGSLYKAIKHKAIKIDLLSAREKTVSDKERKDALTSFSFSELLSNFRVDFRVVTLAILICAFSFVFGLYQLLPLKKEISNLINKRPKFSMVDANSSYDNLISESSRYQNKIKELNRLIKREAYITEQIDALPRIVQNGMWLTNLSFSEGEINKREIIIKGSAYLKDNEKELQLINKFFALLKQNPKFERYSKNMYIISVGRSVWGTKSLTNFEISCRDYK